MRKYRKKQKVKSLNYIVRSSLIFISMIPVLIYICLNSLVIWRNFNRLETTTIQEKLKYVDNIFKSTTMELQKIATDYSVWNDVYYNTIEKNTDWMAENISEWLPSNFNVDLTLISNKEFEIIDKFGIDGLGAVELVKNSIFTEIIKGDIDKNVDSFPRGLIKYKDDIYLIGIGPILKTNYEGTSEGVLIIGKKITPDFLEEINKKFGFDVFVSFGNKIVSRTERKEEVAKYMNSINDKSKRIFIPEKQTILGSYPFVDIFGDELGYVFVIESRESFTSTFNLIFKNGLYVFCITIVIIIILEKQLRRDIIKPILNLENEITGIVGKNKLEQVSTHGPKEILKVINVFNQLIESVINQRKENERLRKLSLIDSETKLYSDKHFFECFQNKLIEGNNRIVILFGQIDDFHIYKDVVNDVKVTNSILKKISDIMLTVLEGYEISNESVSKYQEDKFIIMLDNYIVREAKIIGERIIVDIRNHYPLQKYAFHKPITISIGVSSYPQDGSNVREVLNNAEEALKIARRDGGNKCMIYEKNNEE